DPNTVGTDGGAVADPGLSRVTGPRGDTTDVARRLDHVFWIGGGSAAGKSTIARRLATEYGLQVYATDTAMSRHAAALTPEQAPQLAHFRRMTMNERWLDRPPELMLDSFHWFQGE